MSYSGEPALRSRSRPARRWWLVPVVAMVLAVLVGAVVTLTSARQSSGKSIDRAAPAVSVSPPTAVVKGDFEDGTAQGWLAQGNASVTNSTAQAHGGQHSLLVDVHGGAQPGVALELQSALHAGTEYALSVWVRLAPGAADAALRFSMSWGWASDSDETIVASGTATSAGWVRLAGTYTLPASVESLTATIEPAPGNPAFFVDDFAVTYVPGTPEAQDIPALKDVLKDDFTVGAAVSLPQLTGAESDLVKRQFGSITATNAMKWNPTEGVENTFTFSAPDQIVDFAAANGIKVRGHTLIWYNQTPAWVFQDADGQPMTPTPENKALLLSRLENHIKGLVGHYRGKIYAWDVVNEAISDDGSMRNSMWYQIAGLDYVKDAFITAHAADPAAKLCINDFNLTQPTRRDAMYQLVASMKAQGVPIDCIGSQMHENLGSITPASAAASIDKFAKLGVDQQITELDISVYTDNTSSYATISPSLLAQQAALYKGLFAVFEQRRAKVSSVTFWGVGDDQTWLNTYPITRTDAPLLFDTQLRPKPAFWAVVGTSAAPTVKPTS